MTDAAPRRGHAGWIAGVAIFLLLVYVAFNTATTHGPGARGLAAGAQLPAFAVPLAQSAISCAHADDPCDANVATKAGQGQAGARPACDVRGPTILNLCQLAERGPVVIGFLATRGGDCASQLDVLQGVAARHPGVQVAVIGIRGGLGELRTVISAHHWTFPVGWDRDGILANLYGVAICPEITYARWHGRTVSTSLGAVGPAELERRVRAAIAASLRAGWKAPA